ncbi:protease modulator HflK [Pseudomonas deceptionensis]|uniref:Regulator of protease activity HflC, stomatin/prohibitin superfamily n=1 Tax=Pseudomonas deceptionensis TaxID=882211 RepID=A0A0J6G5H1_PSEDM|nr:protease modulator HflK [Pseudomonas deceptionensis]KMM77728.1 membrane protein [Pseudomonas deceptionensis]SEE42831.1 Regulator of protease activity HflC, stomatin/prohibitin superfamily [Pseudomonas deceptionensis]
MRVDLDAEEERLESLPRFQSASAQASQLYQLSAVLAVLVILAWALAFSIGLFSSESLWPVLLNNNAAALLVLGAGAQSAYWVARWRREALNPAPEVFQDEPDEQPEGIERLNQRINTGAQRLLATIGEPVLWLAGVGGAAWWSVQHTWSLALPGYAMGAWGSIAAGLAIALAFALLVFERYLAQQLPAQWPEAHVLAPLARVPILTFLLSAVCLLFSSDDALWPARLAVLTGLLPAAVAIELILRAVAALFSPRRDKLEPRMIAQSFVAGMLRWPPQPLLALQHELHNRFGIDLRQIWAFTYMRKAFFPVLAVVVAVGWVLSGVNEIPLQGRGIYERFGKPVDVLGPGLHAGLPWPLGRVLAVENGVVHELATSTESTIDPLLTPADGLPPLTANRLWDATHVNDKSQVIASDSGDRQGFQIVNMDVRFVYRIGLSDRAAMAATYHSDDVPTLIRSTASRILVHDFASRTLDGVLGEQRSALADDIGRAVQADLDTLDSGVEILATVVEAIHPPAGAANAYHGVQAAQISAQALIARERGAASEQTNVAQLQASVALDQAHALAREVNATAQTADLRFGAEQKAYASAGHAFLLEQYLSQLSLGLNNARLLILDHRLGGSSAPTLDLRSFTLPADPVAPRKAAQ